MPFDPFSGDSGLKDDYDGTIESALFVPSDFGGYQLQLVIAAEDGDEPTLSLSIGAKSGFTSSDGGETVSGPKANSRFNTNTAYFKFLYAAMNAGAEDELRERSENLYGGYGPMYANLWVGLRFHFDVIYDLKARRKNEDTDEFELIKDESGNVIGKPVVTPTKYLGVGDTTGLQSTLSDSADLDTITSLAKLSSNHKAFTDAVMGLEGSDGRPFVKNPQIMAKAYDQKWYAEVTG